MLLIDDDDINLKLGRINLETIGFSVDTAENGKEALEKWRSVGYTFVFLDIQMPVMDGYEAARAIRAEETKPRGVRIIALTAGSLAEEIEKCYTVGMDDFVSKPIDRDRITAVVKKYS